MGPSHPFKAEIDKLRALVHLVLGRANAEVTAVTATAPVVSSGGATPNISLTALARGWADSGSSPIPIPAGDTIAASVTVTPRVSGRFRVWITCAVDNALGSTVAQITPGVGHNGSGSPDYAPPNNGSETIQTGDRGNVSLVVDLDQIPGPMVFPLGTPVTFDAIVLANTGTGTVVPAHNCQIAVQEVQS